MKPNTTLEQTVLQPDRYVLHIQEIDKTQSDLAGGKGAHLGQLSRIDGIPDPRAFASGQPPSSGP